MGGGGAGRRRCGSALCTRGAPRAGAATAAARPRAPHARLRICLHLPSAEQRLAAPAGSGGTALSRPAEAPPAAAGAATPAQHAPRLAAVARTTSAYGVLGELCSATHTHTPKSVGRLRRAAEGVTAAHRDCGRAGARSRRLTALRTIVRFSSLARRHVCGAQLLSRLQGGYLRLLPHPATRRTLSGGLRGTRPLCKLHASALFMCSVRTVHLVHACGPNSAVSAAATPAWLRSGVKVCGGFRVGSRGGRGQNEREYMT